MRIEEVIGQRIQELRKAQADTKEMTQEDLGESLGRYLERPWSRQAVSAAEKGQRAFTSVELAAFALVFDVPVQRLLSTSIDVSTIEMPSGVEIDPRSLTHTSADKEFEIDPQFSARMLREVIDRFKQAAEEVREMAELAARTRQSITTGYEAALDLEAMHAVITWKEES